MKKFVLILSLILCSSTVFCEDKDYIQIYQDLDVPKLRYVHDIDPGEYYDQRNTAWSPYPLFRLISPLYFKTITVEPGYYLLTPREKDGNWYMLFKESGKVKYVIPIYEREIVPATFYDDNLPKEKTTPSQKLHLKMMEWVGKHGNHSMREPIPKTFLELTDLDDNFVSLVIYWGDYRYYTIFRTVNF